MSNPRAEFRSFWMGGFESASHLNRLRERVDLIAGTRHDVMAQTDYQLLQSEGFGGARDALRWHLVDPGSGHLDFSSFLPQLEAACETGTQVIWSLCHYGLPEGIDVFSPEFIQRFVRFAVATAKLVKEHTDDIPYWTPINEVSFFSWAASRCGFYPYSEGRDDELKRQLVRATVAACAELRNIDPRCRFVYPEPIIHVVSPEDRPNLVNEAKRYEDSQFEAWDMLAGHSAPELGGNSEILDIIGMNFYHSNQWQLEGGPLLWEKVPRDSRWLPLSRMMERVWRRYQRPLFLAETSHVGIGRAPWILEVAAETATAMAWGVPIEGICLFPILDRYEWDNPEHWHNSGLWDLSVADGTYSRILNQPYADAVRQARTILSPQ